MKTTLCWSERPSSICESFLGFMSAKKHLQTVGVLTFSPHKQTEALVAKKTQLKKEKKTLLDWSYIWLWWHWHVCTILSLVWLRNMRQYWGFYSTAMHIRDGLHICKVIRVALDVVWFVSKKESIASDAVQLSIFGPNIQSMWFF